MIFAFCSISVAQDLIPKGETYINEESDMFVFTPQQAQQIKFWKEDADRVEFLIREVEYADSLNTLYIQRIELMENYIQSLEDFKEPSTFDRIQSFGTPLVVGIAVGLFISR